MHFNLTILIIYMFTNVVCLLNQVHVTLEFTFLMEGQTISEAIIFTSLAVDCVCHGQLFGLTGIELRKLRIGHCLGRRAGRPSMGFRD